MEELPQEEVARVGRAIVMAVAPAELMLFRSQSEEYFRDPKRALAPPKSKENPLGFGAAEVVPLLTPFVLHALGEVLRAFEQDIARQLGLQASGRLRQVMKRLFGKAEADPIALSHAQLRHLHRVALDNAGPDPAHAKQIADAIIAALSLAPDPKAGEAPGR